MEESESNSVIDVDSENTMFCASLASERPHQRLQMETDREDNIANIHNLK